MKPTNFRLRLQLSLLGEVQKLAGQEGITVDQLINVAVAEKLSAFRTEAYFRERAARADLDQAREILTRAGKGNPPIPGDEPPQKRGS